MKLNGTQTDLALEIKTLHDQGSAVYSASAQVHHRSLFYRVRRRFGAWDKGLEAAELNPEQIKRYKAHTPETIITTINGMISQGISLTTKDILNSGNKEILDVYYAATRIKDWGADNVYVGWPGAVFAATRKNPAEYGIRIIRSSYKDNHKPDPRPKH